MVNRRYSHAFNLGNIHKLKLKLFFTIIFWELAIANLSFLHYLCTH